MPIRHCQKCGLKVLIDESQAGANPFYCQRCTTAMKSSEQAEVAVSGLTPVKRDVPSAVSPTPLPSPTPQPVSSAPARSTVKVLCPYCKASFNGRVPQKPARGACPVCQKELILLPTGDIRPSQGFDIGKWQQEIREGPPRPMAEPEPVPVGGPPVPSGEKESGTRLLIKKYAAEAPPAPVAKSDLGTRVLSRKQADPPPAEPPSPPTEGPGHLPDWLEEKPKGRPETDELLRQKEHQRDPSATESGEAVPDDVSEATAEAPPVDEPLAPPPKPRVVVRSPAAARAAPPPPEPEPMPEAPPEPAPGPSKKPTLRRLDRKPEAAPALAESAPTGGGKVFVAWALLILPLAACPVLLNSRDKLKGPIIEKLGGMFQKGFHALYLKLVPPPPPPKPAPVIEEKKPEPPPPEAPRKPDPEERKKEDIKLQHMNDEILRLQRDEKGFRVAENPDQKKKLDELHSMIEEKKVQYQKRRDQYKLIYGEDFKPNQ
jgi:hypothetical protein